MQSGDQLQTQQRVSERGTPEFSVSVRENDRGKLRVMQGYHKSRKRQIKGKERKQDWGTDGEKKDGKIIKAESDKEKKGKG